MRKYTSLFTLCIIFILLFSGCHSKDAEIESDTENNKKFEESVLKYIDAQSIYDFEGISLNKLTNGQKVTIANELYEFYETYDKIPDFIQDLTATKDIELIDNISYLLAYNMIKKNKMKASYKLKSELFKIVFFNTLEKDVIATSHNILAQFEYVAQEFGLSNKDNPLKIQKIVVNTFNNGQIIDPAITSLYSGRAEILVFFEGIIDDIFIPQYVNISRNMVLDEVNVLYPEDKDISILKIVPSDDIDVTNPLNYKVTISGHITDSLGYNLGENIELNFTKVAQPDCEITLLSNNDNKSLDYNYQLTGIDKLFKISFSKNMDMKSVENTILKNALVETPKYEISIPHPEILFDWKNDKLLYLYFKDLKAYTYSINLTGATDIEGGSFFEGCNIENRFNYVFQIKSLEKQRLLLFKPGNGELTDLFSFNDEMFHSTSGILDSQYISLSRFEVSPNLSPVYFDFENFTFTSTIADVNKDYEFIDDKPKIITGMRLSPEGKSMVVFGMDESPFGITEKINMPDYMMFLYDSHGKKVWAKKLPFTYRLINQDPGIESANFYWYDENTIIIDGFIEVNSFEQPVYHIYVLKTDSAKIQKLSDSKLGIVSPDGERFYKVTKDKISGQSTIHASDIFGKSLGEYILEKTESDKSYRIFWSKAGRYIYQVYTDNIDSEYRIVICDTKSETTVTYPIELENATQAIDINDDNEVLLIETFN